MTVESNGTDPKQKRKPLKGSETKADTRTHPSGTVTAVLVASVRERGYRGPTLTEAITAACDQSSPPSTLIVVDTSTTGHLTEDLDLPWGEACNEPGSPTLMRVKAPDAPNFGAAITAGLELASAPASRWYWLLHDDMVAGPTALKELVEATVGSSKIAVVGPKQVRYGQRDRLLSLGIDATQSARRVNLVEVDEIDQGQHDSREDVLAVGSAGMLVRVNVWDEVGGFDPVLGPFGDGLEFGRRVHLAGYRVIVAPKAVVEHVQDSHDHQDGGLTSFARRRAAQLYNWLIALPLWMVLPTFLWLPVLTAGRATVRLLQGKPKRAWAEVQGYLKLLSYFPALLAGRARVRRVSKVPRGTLATLMSEPNQIRALRRTDRKIVSERANPVVKASFDEGALRLLHQHQVRSWSTFFALIGVFAVLSLLAWYPYSGGIRGGLWGTLPNRWDTLVAQAFSGWQPVGDGFAGPSSPILVSLTALSAPLSFFGVHPGGVALLIFFLALPIAAWGGWILSGSLTRSPSVRAATASLWAASPALLIPLMQGSMAAVLAYLALAPAFTGFWRALRPCPVLVFEGTNDVVKVPRGDRVAWGSIGVFFALVAVSAAPITLIPIAVLVTALALTAGSGWVRAHRMVRVRPAHPLARIALPVFTAAAGAVLVTPYLALGGSEELAKRLLGPLGGRPGFWLLAGFPTNLPVAPPRAGFYAPLAAGEFPAVLFALGALSGLAVLIWSTLSVFAGPRSGSPFAVRVSLWGGGIALWGAAVLIHYLWLPDGPSIGLLIAGNLALLAAVPASCGPARIPAYAHRPSRDTVRSKWARGVPSTVGIGSSLVGIVALLILGPTGLLEHRGDTGGGGVANPFLKSGDEQSAHGRLDAGQGEGSAAEIPTRFIFPAVHSASPRIVQEAQDGPRAARLLTLREEAGELNVHLLRGPGVMLADFGGASVAQADEPVLLAAGSLADAAATLTVRPSADAVSVLAEHAVDIVLLSGASTDFENLQTTLDANVGLERIGDFGEDVMWRVRPDHVSPSRVTVQYGGSRSLALDSQAVAVNAEYESTRMGTLVLAELKDGGWRASFDGTQLEGVDLNGSGSWRQAFEIPAGSGEVRVHYESAYTTWWLGLLIGAAAILALMAIPWRVRPGALLPQERDDSAAVVQDLTGPIPVARRKEARDA